ncbi:MAG: hypothetical protein B7X33_01880 [Lysobacterales bacterium 13-68-4]|nr:MAG: hypothetical protein B7X33_01880 [Xanthomonadales bacterium 13-68-4]
MARHPLATNPDFRLLFGGSTVSMFGDQFTLVALPWLVLKLTGDPGALGLVLATMAGQAVGRAWQHTAAGDALARPARRAALGALLFMASDSLLAWDRFRHALPWSALWVLGTYYPAIGLIAWSVRRGPDRAR